MASVNKASTTTDTVYTFLVDDSLLTSTGVAKKKGNLVQPDSITGAYSLITANKYGGKAASLYKLVQRGASVPPAWGLRCDLTFKRPKIDFSVVPNQFKYAVRSGAPTSMPGLLETKLGVDHKDLQEAVEAVWDSWNSPHAKAYREAKGIEDTGTGVIIQRWLDSEVAGVAFTADPNNPEEKETYDPIIEYVVGQGNQLVSGAVEPIRAYGNNSGKWYSYVNSWAKALHSEWGPSDIEWAYHKNIVYLLQWRPLKFADVPVVIDENDAEGHELIKKGKPVGSPKKAVLNLVSSISKFKPGDALIVEDFAAELYPYMMKAGAIICATGGNTCHAAIIARELGIIAVSNVTSGDLKGYKKAFISGVTGCVYKINDGDKVDKLEVITKEFKPPYKPNLAIINEGVHWNVNHLMIRFYDTLNKFTEKEIDEVERDERIREIAHVLSTYFYTISLCELRHLKRMASGSTATAVESLIRELRIRGCKVPSFVAIDRTSFRDEGVPQPASIKRIVELLDLAHKGYTEFSWSSAYGGAKWGNIAKIALDYFKGELNDTLFLDACFNLQHNGGRAFNKFTNVTCDEWTMVQQLNSKSKSHTHLMNYCKETFPKVFLQEFLSKPRLLEHPIYQPVEAEDPLLDEPARLTSDLKKEAYMTAAKLAQAEQAAKEKEAAKEAIKEIKAKAATASVSGSLDYIDGCNCFECKANKLKAAKPEEE